MSKDEQEKKSTKKKNYHEDESNPLDEHEEQMFVDDIPLKELKIATEQEKNKHKSQDDSQSSNKK